MKTRKSPVESATLFKVGTKKRGQDGQIWIVKKTKTGVQRWVVSSVTEKKKLKKIPLKHRRFRKHKKTKTKTPTNNLCNSFVFYSKKKGHSFHSLFGLAGPKKRTIYRFLHYNTFDTKLTTIPKDYQLKKIKPEFREKYYCGSKQPLLPSNPTYPLLLKKWKLAKHYFIHDNYSRPFLIYLLPHKIGVYRIPPSHYIREKDYHRKTEKNRWMYIDPILQIDKPLKVWIGKSTNTSGAYDTGKQFDGNNILIEIKKGHYIHIGPFISTFTSQSPIVAFESNIGNNDVPYPFAVDQDGYVYILLEGKKLKIPEDVKDPYEYYYLNRKMIRGILSIPNWTQI